MVRESQYFEAHLVVENVLKVEDLSTLKPNVTFVWSKEKKHDILSTV